MYPTTKKGLASEMPYIACAICLVANFNSTVMFTNKGSCIQLAFTAVFFSFSTNVFSQSIVTVTDSNPHGWMKEEQYLGKIRFANGPSKPPLQNGSLEFDAPVNGHVRHVRMRNSNYSGVLLSSITELSYSTFVQKADSKRDAPLLVLLIDIDGDGTDTAHIFFIPRLQDPDDTTGISTKFGWYKPKKIDDKAIRWQYPINQNVWQNWDALHGGWATWTIDEKFNANPPLFSLSSFISHHPHARIVSDRHGGGVRIQAGGIPMADHFLGNVDAFAIGIDGKTTVYDFELDTDTTSSHRRIDSLKSANNEKN